MIYSELESKRFKAKIFRDKINDFKTKDLQQELIKNDADIAIIRLPSNKLYLLSKLDIIGFPYIVADTLVYYECKFNNYLPKALRNVELEFEKCTSQHGNLIEELTGKIFPNYISHYNSNPFLDKKLILDGYKEWARGYTATEGKVVFLVKKNGIDIGFATCSWDNDTKKCEGVLYGVLPEYSGGGVYSDIIRYTQEYFRKQGFEKMIVSTQTQNIAVQKVWNREGFELTESYNTIHVNCMLNKSTRKIEVERIEITDELIDKLSNDLNPIHFNEYIAKEKGFEGRIAHGLTPSLIISKYFGTQFPGVRTDFLNYKYLFYMPLYLGRTYKIQYQFPDYVENFKVLSVVVKVLDSENNLCLLSYNQIIKR